MTIRCTGACCDRFVLSGIESGRYLLSVDELADDDEFRPFAVLIDVIPADAQTGAPAAGRFGCSAWDSQTRLCTIYDRRPDMCRRYPSNLAPPGCELCGARSHEEAVAQI